MGAVLRREDVLASIASEPCWDVIVVGGGATGLGAAVESASRGYRTVLLEACDFAKGTSSRSTKLVHGGVRYLQQGNVSLVLEALKERGRILRNAPHLASRRAFIVPAYSLADIPFYRIGLGVYDLLARREGIGRSRLLSSSTVRQALPTLQTKGLRGGILYYDGQFDDARFAIALLRTLFDLNGLALNYMKVTGLLESKGTVAGVNVEDVETRSTLEIKGKVVINATGVFVDDLRRMDEVESKRIVTVSQGSHLVLPKEWLPGDYALMLPKTSDGRVLFAIPWHDHVVIGTTDDPVSESSLEPTAREAERTYLAEHVSKYLSRTLVSSDVCSIWSGQRPLVRKDGTTNTSALARDHTILTSSTKLITITGGKWTTYRKMGEDVINRAAVIAGLPVSPSRTADMRLHGWSQNLPADNTWHRVYGADLPALESLEHASPDLKDRLHHALPFRRSEVVWSARNEMARSVEDVLARRTRALFLNARASIEAAPLVAKLLASELNRSVEWQQEQLSAYASMASHYIW